MAGAGSPRILSWDISLVCYLALDFHAGVLTMSLGHGNSYPLDIDGDRSNMSTVEGDGVELDNIMIRTWKGTEANGAQRGPIKVKCAGGARCTDITIEDFAMWTEEGDYQKYTCESAYGDGVCLRDGNDHTSYTESTVAAAPSGYSTATMASDLATTFGTDSSIPTPVIPTPFYPGVTPYSALASTQSTS